MVRPVILRVAAGFALLGAVLSGPSFAQSKAPAAPVGIEAFTNLFNPNGRAPDINSVPILASIVQGGAKLYYLGERSGLHGFFIVKNGQIQMIYVTGDGKTALIGAMFTGEGENVTGPQVTKLSERDREIYQLLNGASQEQGQVAQATAQGGVAALTSDPALSAVSSKGPVNELPGVTVSPGDRLYQDMKAASGVELGKADAPEVMIIVAPKCPNCKKTWAEIREDVKGGKIKARLIPVYNSMGPEEVNMSAQLLRSKDPMDAWDRHVSGDAQALSGTPDETATRAVIANLNLVSKWNIKGYPYLVYRGKDGRVKIVQGKPERMAAVLLDLSR